MLLRVLLAVTALLLIGAITARKRRARLFGLALAFPVALLTYGVLGAGIARVIGIGRFYSVPFGAEQVGDRDVLASLAFWTCLWAALILWLLRHPRGTRSSNAIR